MKDIPITFDEIMAKYGTCFGVPCEDELFAILAWKGGYRVDGQHLVENDSELKVVLHKRISPKIEKPGEIYAIKIAVYTPYEDASPEKGEVWIKNEVFEHTLEEDADFFSSLTK